MTFSAQEVITVNVSEGTTAKKCDTAITHDPGKGSNAKGAWFQVRGGSLLMLLIGTDPVETENKYKIYDDGFGFGVDGADNLDQCRFMKPTAQGADTVLHVEYYW